MPGGGRYEVKVTQMNELLGTSADMLGRARKGIIIRRRFAEDLWQVEVDRGQMEQVFMNIIMNALEAMPKGGTLSLETKNVLLDESTVKPFEINPGPYVKISVTDTGIGMDQKTRDRIFEPFFTTKEMGQGAGLGMASVYGIIRGHGGMITVQSEPGHGSAITICLPIPGEEDDPPRG